MLNLTQPGHGIFYHGTEGTELLLLSLPKCGELLKTDKSLFTDAESKNSIAQHVK
jgi:hypothetical protein